MNQHAQQPSGSERAYGLTLTDAQPLSSLPAVWRLAELLSTLFIGAVAVVVALYLGRSLLLPVVAALIVGIPLLPIVKAGSNAGVPSYVSAVLVVALLTVLVGTVLTLFAAPLTEWIQRSDEIRVALQEKLRVLDYPLAVLREIKSAVMPAQTPGTSVSVESNPAELVGTALVFLTPAVSQLIVFFGTLIFFLATSVELRRKLVVSFVTRDGRLRMLRIWNDIEHNLVGYVGLVTLINIALGTVTAAMLYLVGFPNPLTFGLLTAVLNYIPYIGPAVVTLVLLAVGLVAMPSLLHAALAPALFIAIATVEGHFLTPSLVGRRLTLSPFIVFLALAFWTWLWGPIGAFLAVPLVIVSFVVLGHVFPRDESSLPA